MLESLHVRNYVLIDSLDLDFSDGFTVITGETGSGKSIILGALSLLLGQKADKEAVRKGSEMAEVSGTFSIGSSEVLSWCNDHEIEVEDNYLGRVMSDIQRLNGTFDIPQSINNKSIITGRGPVSTFMDYQLELISFTKGTGRISLNYDGYDECHNTEEVIKNKNYNKDSDEDFFKNYYKELKEKNKL